MKRYNRGEKLTATDWNEMVDRLTRLEGLLKNVRGAGGINVSTKGGSLNVSFPDTEEAWWGVIVNAGPDGGEDYSDGRYWVQRARIGNDDEDAIDERLKVKTVGAQVGDTSKGGTETETNPRRRIVTATNLAESVSGGHTLPYGQFVYVRRYRDGGSPPQERYVFNVGVPQMFIEITGSSLVGGKSNVYAYQWKQVYYLGSGQWADVPSGFTHADANYGGLAYNTVEKPNGATGVQGNGVDLSIVPSTFTLRPIANGAVFAALRVSTCDEPPKWEWLFSSANAVQGPCP